MQLDEKTHRKAGKINAGRKKEGERKWECP